MAPENESEGGRGRITDEEYLDEVRRVSEEVGRAPTRDEFDKHGKFSAVTGWTRFGSWSETLREAGLDPESGRDRGARVTEEEYVEEVQRLAEGLDRVPRWKDMDEHGKYSAVLGQKLFGSWEEVLTAADIDREETDEE